MIFPNDHFVFGQYKNLKVRISNISDVAVDEIYLLNNNPLSTGFFFKKLDPIEARMTKEINLIIRATVLKKYDRVDFLVITNTNNFLRIKKFEFEFRITNSFKTKCMLEKIGFNKFLVGIDIFDAKDNNINPLFFSIDSLVLLSNTFAINFGNYPLQNVNNNFLISQNLIYFELVPTQSAFGKNILRVKKDIFYDPSNILKLNYSGEEIKKEKLKERASEQQEPINLVEKEENFIGLLKEESRAVRHEFNTLQQKIQEKFDYKVEFYCDEFLDFELLWEYKNIGLFGREATVYSPENDRNIEGIHSIISTPINLVSYRYKKSKPITNPIYSITVQSEPYFKHDFSQSQFAKKLSAINDAHYSNLYLHI